MKKIVVPSFCYLDEARDFETQKLQNIYGAGMKVITSLLCLKQLWVVILVITH